VIEISRPLVRAFRAVLKKIATANGHREPVTTVVFQTDRLGLHLRARNSSIAVEFSQPGSFSAEELALPADALADFDSRKEGTITLERSANGISASWQEGIVPQVRSYGVVDAKQLPVIPPLPTKMEHQPAELLGALRDASASAANDAIRYALNKIQLRGNGKIAATDGKQLLVQDGFRFPWDDDVLMPASAVFGCKELASYGPIHIGRSEKFVTLSIGPWTLHFAIDKAGRFPNVDAIIPDSREKSTLFEIDPTDAEFLLGTLDSLPRDGEDAAVTLDGDRMLVVRAKGEGQPTATEVVLAQSQVQGKSVRVAVNRRLLCRALQFGFNRIQVYAAEKPILCRDEKRMYLWQPLDKSAILGDSKDAIRLSSTDGASRPAAPRPAARRSDPSEAPLTRTNRITEELVVPEPNTSSNGTKETNGSDRPGFAEIVAEAEAIRDLFRQGYTRTHELLANLKRYRKQAQVVRSSLKALKDLQHIDA
jgi:hypothetical protein